MIANMIAKWCWRAFIVAIFPVVVLLTLAEVIAVALGQVPSRAHAEIARNYQALRHEWREADK